MYRPSIATRLKGATYAMLAALAVGGCEPNVTGSDPDVGDVLIVADLTDLHVTGLAVEVTAADFPDPLVFNISIENGIGSGVISIPVGADRTITVTAFNDGGLATHQGSRTIAVVRGANPQVSIALLPFEGDVPVEVTGDPLFVTMTPPNGTILSGESLQLTAVVTDGGGNVIQRSVRWGSTNPVVARVDANGLVSGLVPGAVNIVASVAGASGMVAVTVLNPGVQPFTIGFFGGERALDLDAGSVVECDVLDGCQSTNPPGWDLRISYNASVAVHSVVVQNQGVGLQIAHLVGVPFANVSTGDVLSASFTTGIIGDSFDATRVILIRTNEGRLYKLGNPVETETGVTFDAQLLPGF